MDASAAAPVLRLAGLVADPRRHNRLHTLPSMIVMAVVAVLCGAFISTVTTRLSTFGLNDIKGVFHAGFDEGAWITTSYGIGQMLVGVASPYRGAVFGVRRVLLEALGGRRAAAVGEPT